MNRLNGALSILAPAQQISVCRIHTDNDTLIRSNGIALVEHSNRRSSSVCLIVTEISSCSYVSEEKRKIQLVGKNVSALPCSEQLNVGSHHKQCVEHLLVSLNLTLESIQGFLRCTGLYLALQCANFTLKSLETTNLLVQLTNLRQSAVSLVKSLYSSAVVGSLLSLLECLVSLCHSCLCGSGSSVGSFLGNLGSFLGSIGCTLSVASSAVGNLCSSLSLCSSLTGFLGSVSHFVYRTLQLGDVGTGLVGLSQSIVSCSLYRRQRGCQRRQLAIHACLQTCQLAEQVCLIQPQAVNVIIVILTGHEQARYGKRQCHKEQWTKDFFLHLIKH